MADSLDELRERLREFAEERDWGKFHTAKNYTYSITAPITTIAALFPSRPSNDDIALLNHYGVDCVYRSASGTFSRDAANPSRREIWKPA
jgi:hypothetical protein